MRNFPPGFVFGASTAAYQIEGALDADGKGESVWDRFCHTPGKVKGGDTGDVACDHYRRFEEDLDLAAAANLTAYRFSLNWTRLFPDGDGAPNGAGFAFYDRLIDACRARGLEPWICLYHWDFSQKLQDRGGWANRDSIGWFADLASAAGKRWGDRVTMWALFNEPSIFTTLGLMRGEHAPGLADPAAYGAALVHVNLATAAGFAALRAAAPAARIGTILALNQMQGASDSEADTAIAWRADALFNRSFADPLFNGTLPDELRALAGPHLRDGDEAAMKTPIDWLGVNHYSRMRVSATPDGLTAAPPGAPVTEMGWEIRPEGLREILSRVRDDYAPVVPIYVTENGGAFPDRVEPDGSIRDHDRIALFDGYLGGLLDAIDDGVDVRGYLLWSLMDNFEWAHGFSKRFGIVHVDYTTQQRTPKASHGWIAEVAKANALP